MIFLITGILIAYIIGLGYGYGSFSIGITILSAALTVVLVSYKSSYSWRLVTPFLILFVMTGIYRYHSSFYHMAAQRSILIGKEVSCRGWVKDIRSCTNTLFSTRLTIQLKELLINDQWMPFTGTIWLYTKTKKVQKIKVGDYCAFNKLVLRSSNNSSFILYLAKEGIAASSFSPVFSYALLYRPTWCIQRTFFYLKESLITFLTHYMSPVTATLYSRIFLGNTSEDLGYDINRIKHLFSYWGLSHQLARSGLHMSLIAALWYFVFRFVPLHMRYRHLFIMLFACCYYLLSWSSIPFARAFIVFILHTIGAFFYLNSHFLHLLNIVCFATLFYNPFYLGALDFQLSFGLTYAIAFFSHLRIYSK